EGESGCALMSRDGAGVTYRLHRAGAGRWAGRCLSFPEADAVATSERDTIVEAPADRASRGLVDGLPRAAGFRASDPTADEKLGEPLRLLDRVEPGVAARLEWLAR